MMSATIPGKRAGAGRRRFLKLLGVSAGSMGVVGWLPAGQGSQAAPSSSLPGLRQTLAAVGKPTRLITTPDGTQVLVLPYGGRVLGLFAPGDQANFYWTHPALGSEVSARAFYASSGWHNSGGDRTWLAPEVDVFLPKYPAREPYFQPRALDPGDYQVVGEGNSLRLVNRLAVTLSRSRLRLSLELAKSFSAAPNPLRHERGWHAAGLAYAGYTQRTSLSLVEGGSAAPVGLWNLVQMPLGGDLLVPTFSRATPKLVFGNILADDLVVSDHLVRYHMRQRGEHKIALRAVATTGRVGYLFEQGNQWSLIIRSYAVNPSGEYVDVPWDDPADLGYSTQACNVNSALGQFSELEYHVPAIGGASGATRCEDATQVWAFRGTQEGVADVARRLLGVSGPDRKR